MTRLIRVAATLLACPIGACAYAQSYPAKPIRMVMPYAADGNMEHWRPAIERAGQILGQPILMEYRPGAGGSAGTDFVAKAAPDGYALVITTMSAMTINQSIYAKVAKSAIIRIE